VVRWISVSRSSGASRPNESSVAPVAAEAVEQRLVVGDRAEEGEGLGVDRSHQPAQGVVDGWRVKGGSSGARRAGMAATSCRI
jgi:hypothetical protein